MSETAVLPDSFADLQTVIAQRHGEMSPRLRQIAEFALANPNDMALETVAVVAERAGVQPSALIRFAKLLGYDGFTDMQRVFRTRLTDSMMSYGQRLRALKATDGAGSDASGILHHFTEAGILALEHLQQEITSEDLDQALLALIRAQHIYVVGFRRSFPVATYLAYALSQLGRRVVLVDHVGGMARQQIGSMDDRDLLLAISFKPYAQETLDLIRLGSGAGVPILAITDSALSPMVPYAGVALKVDDAQVKGFRSLTATMCLAISLVVALGQRLDGEDWQSRTAG